MTAEENSKKFMGEIVETETRKIMEKLDIIVRECEDIKNSSGIKGAKRIEELLERFQNGISEYERILKHNNHYIKGDGMDRSNKFMVELKMLEWIHRFFKAKALFIRIQ